MPPVLNPNSQVAGQRYDRPWYQFGFGEGDPTDITAYYMDPSAAGTTTGINEADYYSYLQQAANRGTNIYGQQQTLAQALADRAAGRGGPSLAELQLGQSLEQNKRDAAGALAAAGRGINPALAQRILMQQRSQLQGQTAGQAAILRAQEQQAAQTALANQLTNMRGAETTAFGQSATAGLNQEQLRANLIEAQKQREFEVAKQNQLAAQAAAGQAQSQGQFESTQGQKTAGAVGTGLIEGGKILNDYNKQQTASAASAASTGAAGKAQGGIVRKYAEGGKVSKAKVIAAHAAAKKNMGAFKEQYGKEEGKNVAYATMMKLAKENKLADGGTSIGDIAKVALPALLLSRMGLPPELAMAGGYAAKKGIDYLSEDKKEEKMAQGGPVKAAMGRLEKMDNEKNDTIPAMLSPGEIVIPRSVVAAPNAPVAAAKFVEALLANRDKKDAKKIALKAALTSR